jgi:hypothetical protein
MEVVYYYDTSLGYCPVKKYFKKMKAEFTDEEKADRKVVEIYGKISHIAQNNGILNAGWVKPLQGYSFFEIRSRKDSKLLIRVTYFCHQKKMVLLDAFEKPDNYNTQKEKNRVDGEFKKSELYKNKFINNPNLYEQYE